MKYATVHIAFNVGRTEFVLFISMVATAASVSIGYHAPYYVRLGLCRCLASDAHMHRRARCTAPELI